MRFAKSISERMIVRAALPAALSGLLLMPVSTTAFEIQKDNGTTVEQRGSSELIKIGATQYLLTPISGLPELEMFSAIPQKYEAGMAHLSYVEPLTDEDAGKVLEAHYRNSAFDIDSVKIRNLDVSGTQYLAWCSDTMGVCQERSYQVGSFVMFEVNGKNRSGGMTGFEKQTFIIAKVPTAVDALATTATEHTGGKLPKPTDEALRKSLSVGVVIEIKAAPDKVATAAREVFAAEGFTVANGPVESSDVFTVPRDLKLTDKTADCGRKLGFSLIGDKRTETTVLLALAQRDGEATVRLGVGGIQRIWTPFGGGAADHELKCASTGVLEADIAAKIAAWLKAH